MQEREEGLVIIGVCPSIPIPKHVIIMCQNILLVISPCMALGGMTSPEENEICEIPPSIIQYNIQNESDITPFHPRSFLVKGIYHRGYDRG